MRNMKISEKLTPYVLFTSLSLAGIITFFLFALVSGSDAFAWVMMRNTGVLYSLDYFQHMLFTAYPEAIYVIANGVWGVFPPLAYVFYRFMFLLTFNGVLPTLGSGWPGWLELAATEHARTVFLYYSICVALLLAYAVNVWKKGNNHHKRLIICLLFSVPFFAGGFERGNSVMVVLPLLLIALKWRDSESKLERELAMIFIAVCAGLKIYPAIFGLLYIKEKRFKEAFRLLGYGIAFFFVPFLFFGGKNAFLLWLFNIIEATKTESLGRLEYFKGVACTLIYLVTGNSLPNLEVIITNLCLVLMILFFFISGDKYRTVFYLCCCMTFFPINAHRYTLSYLAIPLVMYLMENGSKPEKDVFTIIEIVEYSFLFTIPTFWGLLTGFGLLFSEISPHLTYVEFWIYIVAYSLLMTTMVHEVVHLVAKKLNADSIQQI